MYEPEPGRRAPLSLFIFGRIACIAILLAISAGMTPASRAAEGAGTASSGVTSAGALKSITLTPSADTWIARGGDFYSAYLNHGSEPILWHNYSPAYNANGLLKFDLTPYAGRTVVGNAVLSMMVTGINPDGNFSRPIYIHVGVSPWDEYTVTGATYSYVLGPYLTGQVIYPGMLGQRVEWTIPSSVLQDWIDYPSTNYGFFINQGSPALWFSDTHFGSRENAAPPRLSVMLQTTAPEPGSFALLALGVPGVVAIFCRRKSLHR